MDVKGAELQLLNLASQSLKLLVAPEPLCKCCLLCFRIGIAASVPQDPPGLPAMTLLGVVTH